MRNYGCMWFRAVVDAGVCVGVVVCGGGVCVVCCVNMCSTCVIIRICLRLLDPSSQPSVWKMTTTWDAVTRDLKISTSAG